MHVFSAPLLGILSDRYGRKPLLVISLLGSSVGYVIFGFVGVLWILFLVRMIEGLTSGSISTIYAYFSDITPIESRTKYFGWISAFSGIGSIMGPTIGGMLATTFANAAPYYFGALISLLNVCCGILFMPESLDKNRREKEINLKKLNPFKQLMAIFKINQIKWLLLFALFMWIASGSLQAMLSQYTIDTFQWRTVVIGLVFSIIGAQDILSQAFVMPKLIKKLTDEQIIKIVLFAELIGYLFMTVSAVQVSGIIFIIGMFCFGFGDSVFGPIYNGYLSKSVAESEQGRIQGSRPSVQSVSRIIGPVIGGFIYVAFGHMTPMVVGAIFLSIPLFILCKER